MKRAKTEVIGTALLQFHEVSDHINNVDPRKDLLYRRLGYHRATNIAIPPLAGMDAPSIRGNKPTPPATGIRCESNVKKTHRICPGNLLNWIYPKRSFLDV